MSKRARWLGPSSTRRDGPEYRDFVRGRWEEITEAEATYFKRFPGTWEVGEGPLLEVDREVVPTEPPVAEAGAPQEPPVAEAEVPDEEPVAEAEVEGPEVEGLDEVVLVDPSETATPFVGSAIEEESESGFVDVAEPETDRDGGFV